MSIVALSTWHDACARSRCQSHRRRRLERIKLGELRALAGVAVLTLSGWVLAIGVLVIR